MELNLKSTKLVEVGFDHFEMKKERYCLRSFSSLSGQKLTDEEFNIKNLEHSKFFKVESIDTDLSDYDYYIAIAPNGSIFTFQDLLPSRE